MRVIALLIFSAVIASNFSVNVSRAETQDKNVKIRQTDDIENFNKKKIASVNDNFLIPSYDTDAAVLGQFTKKFNYSYIEQIKLLPDDPFSITATAYTASADECGKADGITASGNQVHRGTLACPKSYPFGTKIEIDGMGTYVCEDRGGAINGNHFDIYVPTKSEAFAFGRQTLLAQVEK
jgi:3D (Asp-Asp-Asp) domain-containing protein